MRASVAMETVANSLLDLLNGDFFLFSVHSSLVFSFFFPLSLSLRFTFAGKSGKISTWEHRAAVVDALHSLSFFDSSYSTSPSILEGLLGYYKKEGISFLLWWVVFFVPYLFPPQRTRWFNSVSYQLSTLGLIGPCLFPPPTLVSPRSVFFSIPSVCNINLLSDTAKSFLSNETKPSIRFACLNRMLYPMPCKWFVHLKMSFLFTTWSQFFVVEALFYLEPLIPVLTSLVAKTEKSLQVNSLIFFFLFHVCLSSFSLHQNIWSSLIYRCPPLMKEPRPLTFFFPGHHINHTQVIPVTCS